MSDVLADMRAEAQAREQWAASLEATAAEADLSRYLASMIRRWLSEVDALLVQRAQAIQQLQGERESAVRQFQAAELDAARLTREVADLKTDLALNAQMLARQCDLAREAEAALTARTQALDQLRADAEDTARGVRFWQQKFMELHKRMEAADAARVSRAPQRSENEEDASRVAPLTARAAATGSTASDRTGNAESAERTETMQELIAEYRRIRACSPATPWCPDPRYGNTDHYDGHYEAKDAILEQIFAALLPASAAVIARIVQEVAELPDRTSPYDWPDAMLVTADELSSILAAALRGIAAPPPDQEPT